MIRIYIVAALLLYVCNLNAQNKTAIEKDIRANEQKVVKGILEADTNLLNEVWAPEFIVNTPRNNVAKGRHAVYQNQQAGFINYSSFNRVIEEIQIKKKIVITMGYETFVSRNDTPGVRAGETIKRRFTNIWMRKNGRWMQVGRHASIICS